MRRVINITFDITEREHQLLCWGQAGQPDPQRIKTMLLRDAAKCVRFEIDHTLRLNDEACCPPPLPKSGGPKRSIKSEKLARIAIMPHQHVDHTRFWSPSNPCGEPSCAHCNPPVVA